MRLLQLSKLPILCVTLLLQCLMFRAHAGTIESDSVDWLNKSAREDVLKRVPKWNFSSIAAMFEVYQNPSRYDLPTRINGEQVNYNALFIQSFWGSLENPFAKIPRPAKVFVFVTDSQGKSQYYMAPIVRYEETDRFYVFDKTQATPIKIDDWVSLKTGSGSNVRLNVCDGYGAKPSQACSQTYYENEIYTYPQLDKQVSHVDLHFPSAKRGLHEDWRAAVNRHQQYLRKVQGSVIRTSVDVKDKEKVDGLLSKITKWSKYKKIKKVFKKLRDTRYFQDERDVTFGRRITWLYPDDGCWTRLSAMMKDFFGPKRNPVAKYSRPSKVFVFGNLCVNTPNSKNGHAIWWYHTAPIVHDKKKNKDYVIDPSVDPGKPLLLQDWLDLISSNRDQCAGGSNQIDKINICNGYGVSPYDSCEFNGFERFDKEISSMLTQKFIRRLEYDRQVELGRDANDVLGDNPPWK